MVDFLFMLCVFYDLPCVCKANYFFVIVFSVVYCQWIEYVGLVIGFFSVCMNLIQEEVAHECCIVGVIFIFIAGVHTAGVRGICWTL